MTLHPTYHRSFCFFFSMVLFLVSASKVQSLALVAKSPSGTAVSSSMSSAIQRSRPSFSALLTPKTTRRKTTFLGMAKEPSRNTESPYFPRNQTAAMASSDPNSARKIYYTSSATINGIISSTAANHTTDGSSISPAPPTPFDASSLLSVQPSDIEFIKHETQTDTEMVPEETLRRLPFVSMFRGSANYIANHRNTLAVYHIPGGLLDLPNPAVFRDLMNDVALTWLLGMRIVLVVGCRHQVEKRQKELNHHHHPESVSLPHGLRVTDSAALRIVKEEAGYVRFEVERQLARSLRMQGGGTLGTTPPSSSSSQNNGYYDGNVVSGNFYSAQPFGILEGIDYKYTGFVRRVEVEKIRQVHSSRDICLLTTLGVSPSGEVFNVNSESLAATVAGALGASKVIYFTEDEMELRNKIHGNKIQSLRLSDARNLLSYHGIKIHRKGYVLHTGEGDMPDMDRDSFDMLMKIGWSIHALEQGVKRAHIISPQHGALLQELYTRDGSGTLISGDLYDGIRRATVHDVSAIHDLISPLIAMGTLIDRPKSTLEKDIDTYYVYTRDNHVVACGQLKIFEEGYSEIGCLVVSKDFRSRGRGDAMLGYLERLSLVNGCGRVFILSTQTMEWFNERGYLAASVPDLPPSRQKTYNYQRASKIYMKTIENSRDLDASELWWNR